MGLFCSDKKLKAVDWLKTQFLLLILRELDLQSIGTSLELQGQFIRLRQCLVEGGEHMFI